MQICLIEDEKSISEMIRLNLELEGFKVDCISNGKEALERAHSLKDHNLIILDVMLPEVSGLEICRAIRKYSDVPVLFLSAKGTTEDRIAGLKTGGNDYLPKPFDLEELLLRVNILTHRGRPVSESALLQIGNKTVDFESFNVTDVRTGVVTTLSKKEIELLRLFSEKEGIVISRDEILDKIWGKDQFPTSRTIDNYILSFRKLFEEDARNPVYFHSIRAVGYKFTNAK